MYSPLTAKGLDFFQVPYFYIIKFAIWVKTKHIARPHIVGSAIATKVHFKLPVSLRIVRQVVAQGQCISEKSIIFIAVIIVQPLFISRVFIIFKSFISVRLPCERYVISIIGTTISFAGIPSINAIKITPSIPNTFANGFNVSDIYFSIDMSFKGDMLKIKMNIE